MESFVTLQTVAPDGTRLALIEAGFALFGQKGFAATSTRDIAAAAQTNIASIAYHFGGKQGLRLACADEFARRIAEVMAAGPAAERIPDAAAARRQIRGLMAAMAGYVIGGEKAGGMVAFVLREIVEQGPVVDRVYSRLIAPVHQRLCMLWGAATGQDSESETVRLTVFSLIGQLIYFRIGQSVVTRRMGWDEIGPAELKRIVTMLQSNVDALLGAKEA